MCWRSPVGLWLLGLAAWVCVAQAADDRPGDGERAAGLLRRWAAAQNGGDFVSYRQLYTQAFTGVRRSGNRVVELDRTAWMQERERMFKRKMQVRYRVHEVTRGNSVGRGWLEVRFEQRWNSGRYADRGEKLMLLTEEDGELAILREEMLTSELRNPGTREILWADVEDFIPMIQGHPYLVLGASEAGKDGVFAADAWAQGPIRQEWNRRSGRRLTSRRLDEQRVPPELRGWVGRKVTAFDQAKAKCQTVIRGLRIASQVWADAEERPEGRRTLPASAWAKEDDHYLPDYLRAHLLLAEVEPVPACRGALWARPTEHPLPAISRGGKAPSELEQAGWAAFRSLPDYVPLQRKYLEQQTAPARRWWDENQGSSSTSRRLIYFPPSQGLPAMLVVTAASMSCGDGFEGGLFALFDVVATESRSPTLRLRATSGHLDFVLPLAAIDVDGDGHPEFLLRNGLIRRQGTGYQAETLPEPFLDDC